MRKTPFGPVQSMGTAPSFEDAFEQHEFKTVTQFTETGETPPICSFDLKHPNYDEPELIGMMPNMEDDEAKWKFFQLVGELQRMSATYVTFGYEGWAVVLPKGETPESLKVMPRDHPDKIEVLMIEGINKEGKQIFKSWDIHPTSRQLLKRSSDEQQKPEDSRLARSFLGLE